MPPATSSGRKDRVAMSTLEQQERRPQDFSSVVRGRRSVRYYQDRAVPRHLIEAVLEAARWAPSPHGRQPWRFVILTRFDLKERLADAMGATWRANLGWMGSLKRSSIADWEIPVSDCSTRLSWLFPASICTGWIGILMLVARRLKRSWQSRAWALR